MAKAVTPRPKKADAPAVANNRREQRRLEHHDLSRGQLLDAAEEVFGRKGFHETTLKEVAELAGFSVGSVYSFFENKDDLFRQIFLRRGEEFEAGMNDLFGDTAVAPLDLLHRLVDFQVGFFRAHPHFGRVYLRYSSVALLAARNDQVDEAVQRRYDIAMSQQADLFARGQKAGVLRAGDPEVLSRLFSGLIASFQSIDPAVISDDPGSDEKIPLAEFHGLVERAFGA
jgi:TetR/AcrR family transcriptional regulator